MGTLRLTVESSMSADTLEQNYQRSTSSAKAVMESLSDLFSKINSGNIYGGGTNPPSVQSVVVDNAVAASGTFTLDTVIATDAISINGVTFTCVASGATGNQFNVGADDDETAENLAAAINASVTALVAGYVTASSAAEVVTVTAVETGLSGNAITIASADATIVASGARLTGGAVDTGLKTYTF